MTSKNILVLSSLYQYAHMTQMIEYLAAYRKYSKHNYFYHNFVYDFDPATIEFDRFDVVMLPHNFWPMSLSETQKEALRKTKALKVLFLQDEYQHVRTINAVMDEIQVDLMFTCVAEKDFDVFYPKRKIPSLKGVHGVLTGYVSDYMMQPGMLQLEDKTVDVGFRSRVSPYFLGTIGHEKYRIAEKFGEFARQSGLSTNISVNEEDRLSGRNWIRFLQSCKTQLGTPSGSSIIDFDGRLLKETASYRRAFPRAGYGEVWEDVLKRHDFRHVIDTISPRTFEAAATGSTMVQLEGYYGGYIEPGVHYIEIKSDYSNMADVVEQIRDTDLCRKIAKQAHEDLIASGRFHVRTHVEKFDAILEPHLVRSQSKSKNINSREFYQGLIGRHHQSFIPSADGIEYLNTLEAKVIKDQHRENEWLRNRPVIGKMLRRTGGEPHKKVRKGKAAMALIRAMSPFRPLLFLSSLSPAIKTETVLRDILLLGIIKSAQSSKTTQSAHFSSRLVSEFGDVVIKATSPANRDMSESSGESGLNRMSDVVRVLKTLGEGQIVGDLNEVCPLQDFASTLILDWPIQGNYEQFRSQADLMFHFPALTRLARRHPRAVAKALIFALTPATPAEADKLNGIF